MFDVIYADPPWHFGSRGARGGKFGSLDYVDMRLAEMKTLPVRNLAAENSALFMWSTGSHIPEAIELGQAWGFRYIRVHKVWAKVKETGGRHGVCGPWGMTDCEYLLLFTRGKICSKQDQRNQWVLQEAAYTGCHSEKPAIFRTLIEQEFAWANRIELFARKRVDGWAVWGNEVDGYDIFGKGYA